MVGRYGGGTFHWLCLESLGGTVPCRNRGGPRTVVSGDEDQTWMEEIEKIFIPSEQCKQCHDRHYEEWKGMREQTMDLKTFGRVDGALLHGTALTSPVFQTVLGPVASNQAGLRTTYSVPIVPCAICDCIPPTYGSNYCASDEREEGMSKLKGLAAVPVI